MADYDVIVIGGGPGGYVAAIRCAQLGLKTACIDDRIDEQGHAALGGVCLNVGCIPSKALLDSSHHFHRAQHEFAAHGIHLNELSVDVATMMQRKQEVVQTLTSGIAMLFTKNKVTAITGRAHFIGDKRVSVMGLGKDANEPQELEAEHFIIATGSSAVELADVPYDGERIVDSSGALSFNEVPKRLGVIGGGVIGLELGSVWSRLGAEVSVLVRGNTFLRNADQQLAKQMQHGLKKQGLDIRLNAKLVRVEKGNEHITVVHDDAGTEKSLEVDRLLVATGRTPNTSAIGAEAIGLMLDERGFIQVDETCRTNLPGIYAIGDVVRGPMLAHKASEEGVAVAERIAGQQPEVNYASIPSVIYTWPELAWVGATTEQITAQGMEFKSGVFPFRASGRARAAAEAEGMVKILADAKSDKILGVHIYGPHASELISEAVVAMEFAASAEDLARIIHAHPTLSEAVHEAALAVEGRAIHT